MNLNILLSHIQPKPVSIFYSFWLCVLLILNSCQQPEQGSLIQNIERAHKKSEFLAHQAIRFDLRLFFGGTERLNARVTLLTNSSKGMIESKDGWKIYFDGSSVYHSPELESSSRVRFDALTWSYFFLFPYKLSDPGTKWSAFDQDRLNGKQYITQKLTFAPGTGDAPEYWYVIYADAKTELIEYSAYIVTATKSREDAEADPHAIQYLNYTSVDGIPIATRWSFWEWRKEGGITRQLGTAELKDIQFVDLEDDFFQVPENFIEK